MELIKRYKRQILLPEIRASGQRKLLNSQILVVGCGGLGSAVIPLLTASGIGKLILCDDDRIELSNLNRQFIYKSADVGQKKAEKAAFFARGLNSTIDIQAVTEAINPHNFGFYSNGVDLIIDCTDRSLVKFFLNSAAVENHKPLIHSSAIGFIGQILTIPPGGKPCLQCFFDNNASKVKQNCANAGILGSTCAVIGSLVVNEAIKYLLAIGDNLVGKLQRVDLKTNEFAIYKFTVDPDCSACAGM